MLRTATTLSRRRLQQQFSTSAVCRNIRLGSGDASGSDSSSKGDRNHSPTLGEGDANVGLGEPSGSGVSSYRTVNSEFKEAVQNSSVLQSDSTTIPLSGPASSSFTSTSPATSGTQDNDSDPDAKSTSTSKVTNEESSPASQSPPENTRSPDSSSSEPGPLHPALELATSNLEEVKQRIKHWTENAAVIVRGRADEFTAQTKTTFSQLGAHLNKVTGYEEIEALKRDVVAQEHRINDTRRAARQAKVLYEEAVIQRSKSQREVNDLLQRKSSWTDSDVSRFTTLVRQDHLFEQEEARAKTTVDESEDAVEREFSALMRLILARYHEEQVWSDKIRSASTYGQLAALGLNLLVFLLAIVLVEPWKRKRLAQTFERKVEELSEDYSRMLEGSMKGIEEKLKGHERLLVSMAEELAARENAAPASAPPAPVPIAEAIAVDVVREALEDTASSAQDVKVKVKIAEKEQVKHVRIPGVVDVPLSTRTVELVAVGTGTFVLGLVASLLMSTR